MRDARSILRLMLDEDAPEDDTQDELERYTVGSKVIPCGIKNTAYDQISLTLGRASSRKAGQSNTWLERLDDKTCCVRFYNTRIITCTQGGDTVVDSGGFSANGWQNVSGKTTMSRLNLYLPSEWKLYEHKAKWHWYNEVALKREKSNTSLFSYPFTDRDKIHPNGDLEIQAEPVFDRITPLRVKPGRQF